MKSASITFSWDLPSTECWKPIFAVGHPPDGVMWSVSWFGIGLLLGYYERELRLPAVIPNWLRDVGEQHEKQAGR